MLGRLYRGAKVINFGELGLHGNLAVVFGFGLLVYHVSNFVRRYSLVQDWNVP